MIRNEHHDVGPPLRGERAANRGGLSEFDGQKMAVIVTRGTRRVVLCGTAVFVRDDTVGNTLNIRLEDCEPGHPVLVISESEWDGRIVPDFHFGCDFCLIVGQMALPDHGSIHHCSLQFVSEGLALADEIGALCCVDIAGSFSPESWFGPHPRNLSCEFFDAAIENARKIIDAVKPKRAKFSFEMMGWALPDSAESYLRMIKAVDRPAFAVHLDPCNLINSPSRFYNATDLLNDCFDKLGPRIVSCHAKDVSWTVEMQMHFQEVPIGAGTLDYQTYLKRLASLPQDVPLMIEHMQDAADYDRSRQQVFAVGKQLGLAFE